MTVTGMKPGVKLTMMMMAVGTDGHDDDGGWGGLGSSRSEPINTPLLSQAGKIGEPPGGWREKKR